MLGLWHLSCYCAACREHDFENCEKVAMVGKGTRLVIVREDSNTYAKRLRRNNAQGLVLAKELSAKLRSLSSGRSSKDAEAARDANGPLVALRRSASAKQRDAYSFDLGRMTEEVYVLDRSVPGIFKDKKGKNITLKAGTKVAMVKFFERDPVCANHFVFDGREGSGSWGLVDVKAFVAADITPEPRHAVMRTRRQAAREATLQYKNDDAVLSTETVKSVYKQIAEFEMGLGRWLVPPAGAAAAAAAAAAAHGGGGGGGGGGGN